MATERQIEANKLNSQKSTGPKTEAGKAKSCLNHLSHGFTSNTALLIRRRKPGGTQGPPRRPHERIPARDSHRADPRRKNVPEPVAQRARFPPPDRCVLWEDVGQGNRLRNLQGPRTPHPLPLSRRAQLPQGPHRACKGPKRKAKVRNWLRIAKRRPGRRSRTRPKPNRAEKGPPNPGRDGFPGRTRRFRRPRRSTGHGNRSGSPQNRRLKRLFDVEPRPLATRRARSVSGLPGTPGVAAFLRVVGRAPAKAPLF